MGLAYMVAGERYHSLTSIRHIKGHGQFWLFRCDCGMDHIAQARRVRSGNTKSCGCRRVEMFMKLERRTHGMSDVPEYSVWTSMLNRCYNKNGQDYPAYGGRGIKVCDEWKNDFAAFRSYMGPRPSSQYSIDRYPDNNGDYRPGNVRWATAKQQADNRRSSHFLVVDGDRLSLPDAAIRLGMNYNTLFWRVKNNREIKGAA